MSEKLTIYRNEDGNWVDKTNTRVFMPWHIDDVKGDRPDLTDEQAFDVLNTAASDQNAEVGINFEVLQETARDMYPEPEEEL